jgi:suppressor of fused protein SUFU
VTTTPICPHPPDGVMACGCTNDVLERLFAQAGLPAPSERKLWAQIEAHVAPHLGPLEGVLHDAEPGRVWADVLVHTPSGSRPTIDLVTAGMSAKRMRPPRALRRRGVPQRAEVMLRFPPEWSATPTVTQTLMSRAANWTMMWLQLIARVPHELGAFLGDDSGLDLPCRAIPLFEMPGCPFEAVIAADPARFGRPLAWSRSAVRGSQPGAGDTRFLALVPLFMREFEFALDRGPEALFEALATSGVDDIVRCDREPVV